MTDKIAYGGDYNPEQWPRATWREDVALMREAGVNLVSVGIFSWGLLEIGEGVFDFSWLDEVLGLLHEGGISVDLGTPTASPPAWFFEAYPDARVVTAEGVALGFGSRGAAAPTSPQYRAAATRIATELARRYADHPAVVMWHVHNEYGVPVGEDHSAHALEAWRLWLRERYATIEALNAAWGTAFWGQHYTTFEHVGTPAATPTTVNPAQKLDFARFSDQMLRECFVAERDAIRAHSDLPVTTNFMANQHHGCDLWAWAREVDVVADDHYLWAADEEAHIGLAIAADLSRSVGGGKPWILMEHSTSAVNWQPRNTAKRPGEMARNSLSHLGRGADAILFFQWRAGRSGAEKFHSVMLPHAGTRSRIWREVVDLGATLGRLGEVAGSRVHADVAILWDFESLWAQGLEWRPSVDLDPHERIRAYYERLWRDGITADFAHPSQDLSGYRLVIAPAQYLLTKAQAANLNAYVEGGGTLLVSCFAAAVDENDAVHEGGFGAPLAPSLGLLVEEYLPMREGRTLDIELGGLTYPASVWREDVRLLGADVVAAFADGVPAVTRNSLGGGTGWYVGTLPSAEGLAAVMSRVYADAGLAPLGLPDGVETVTRRGADADYLFALNHTDHEVELPLPGADLVSGSRPADAHLLGAGAVAVLRVPHGGYR